MGVRIVATKAPRNVPRTARTAKSKRKSPLPTSVRSNFQKSPSNTEHKGAKNTRLCETMLEKTMEYESLSNIIVGSFWVILSLASLLLQLRIEVTQAMRNTENSSKGSLRTNHDCVVHSRPSQPEIDLIFPGPWVQPWP